MATAKKPAVKKPLTAAQKAAQARKMASADCKKLIAARKNGTAGSQKTSTVGLGRAKSHVIADQIAAGKRQFIEGDLEELPDDCTPLDLMLMAMRRAYLLGGSIEAAPYAEKAAPYVHGKMSTIEIKNPLSAPGADGKGGGVAVPFEVVFIDAPKRGE